MEQLKSLLANDTSPVAGEVLLHENPVSGRRVVLLGDGTVVKSGKSISLEEAAAIQVAAQAGICVPRMLATDSIRGGINVLQMSHVEGITLSEAWPSMTDNQKRTIALQLGDIVSTMRQIQAPPNIVGACSGGQFRDTRLCHSHYFPSLLDEREFNRYLLSSLSHGTPRTVTDSLERQQRNNHRIVFTHGDLSPSNIIVRDDQIVGIVDWEEAGWFPEYWEYAKFFLRSGLHDDDWCLYASDIFPEIDQEELVLYFSILQWQSP